MTINFFLKAIYKCMLYFAGISRNINVYISNTQNALFLPFLKKLYLMQNPDLHCEVIVILKYGTRLTVLKEITWQLTAMKQYTSPIYSVDIIYCGLTIQ